MRLLLITLLLSSVALAEEKACIAIFEPRPCLWTQKFYSEGKRVLIPAKFGNWDSVFDEQGNELTLKYGLIRGTQKYFVYHSERKPKAVLGQRWDGTCLFVRKR